MIVRLTIATKPTPYHMGDHNMKHRPTTTEMIERQQRRNRMAQRAAGMMACLWLLSVAVMVAGWILTW